MKSKVFVIAGHVSEGTAYAKRKLAEQFEYCQREGVPFNASMSDYIMVHDINSLRGHGEVHGVFVGSFRERHDIRAIVREIRAINNIPSNVQLIPDLYVGRGILPGTIPYTVNVLVHINGVAQQGHVAVKSGTGVQVDLPSAPPAGMEVRITTAQGTHMMYQADGFTHRYVFHEV